MTELASWFADVASRGERSQRVRAGSVASACDAELIKQHRDQIRCGRAGMQSLVGVVLIAVGVVLVLRAASLTLRSGGDLVAMLTISPAAERSSADELDTAARSRSVVGRLRSRRFDAEVAALNKRLGGND